MYKNVQARCRRDNVVNAFKIHVKVGKIFLTDQVS